MFLRLHLHLSLNTTAFLLFVLKVKAKIWTWIKSAVTGGGGRRREKAAEQGFCQGRPGTSGLWTLSALWQQKLCRLTDRRPHQARTFSHFISPLKNRCKCLFRTYKDPVHGTEENLKTDIRQKKDILPPAGPSASGVRCSTLVRRLSLCLPKVTKSKCCTALAFKRRTKWHSSAKMLTFPTLALE